VNHHSSQFLIAGKRGGKKGGKFCPVKIPEGVAFFEMFVYFM